jgi:peptide/nickel transport system substrate-binding protein
MEGVLVGLAVLVVAGGILGSLSLLAHFGVIDAHSASSAPIPVHGGTWTEAINVDADSLIPSGGDTGYKIEGVLYLPLFYGDAQGVIHGGAASEIPTVQNGGISVDGKTWTFHMRPHLVWSDGAPYDARDVDFTWRLWNNPKFGGSPLPANLIASAAVSADHLSITFHLMRAFAPFLSEWVDGLDAPLPAHHFSTMAPDQIFKSSDNLNPKVTSGPFMMAESAPGNHYTVVRNPRYYLAREGLPYLDKIIFRLVADDAALKDLEAGTTDGRAFLDVTQAPAYKRLSHYKLVTTPVDSAFEALYFNFHNLILSSHPEVRQAIAMAIDHQALITTARLGYANPLCTDHAAFYHPGFDLNAGCPVFNPAVANQLLSDNGWVKGPDGVRSKGGQRLEFEYSTSLSLNLWRYATEAIVQQDLQAIGIKLDIQNYTNGTFFGSLLPGGKASPPTGAVADRYDIAEFQNDWRFDPDDSSALSCDQIPSVANDFNGGNLDFYCNHALDALFQQELATVDPGLRQNIFNQIHNIYLTALPFITLYSTTELSIARKGTHNYLPFSQDPFNNSWQWWCANGKC